LFIKFEFSVSMKAISEPFEVESLEHFEFVLKRAHITDLSALSLK